MSSLELPSEKLGCLADAFHLAQTARSFCDMSLKENFELDELSPEVQLLILKFVPFIELVYLDHVTKPRMPFNEENMCLLSDSVLLIEENIQGWNPDGSASFSQF